MLITTRQAGNTSGDINYFATHSTPGITMSTDDAELMERSQTNATWNWYSMILCLVFSVIGIGAVVLAGIALFSHTGPTAANDADMIMVRHLITVVIVIGTLAIAIMITLAVLLQSDSNVMQRFEKAKQVLTILVGILGTVIGFYFGAASQPPIPNNPGTSIEHRVDTTQLQRDEQQQLQPAGK